MRTDEQSELVRLSALRCEPQANRSPIEILVLLVGGVVGFWCLRNSLGHVGACAGSRLHNSAINRTAARVFVPQGDFPTCEWPSKLEVTESRGENVNVCDRAATSGHFVRHDFGVFRLCKHFFGPNESLIDRWDKKYVDGVFPEFLILNEMNPSEGGVLWADCSLNR